MYSDTNFVNPVAPLTVPLGALNATIQVFLAGRHGCGLGLATGTLAATLTPEISIDGVTWVASRFVDVTGAETSTLVLTNPNAASQVSIVVLGGTQLARVRVSSYTSGTANATMVATSAWSQLATTGGGSTTVDQGAAGASPWLVTGAVTQGGTWTVQPGNTANTTAWLVKQVRSTTPAQTSVAGSASSVSLLASNASRLGATIFNDSSAILYLKLGTTASTTSYTAQLASNAYYEVPFNYTGAIDGIWASATGNARITELT